MVEYPYPHIFYFCVNRKHLIRQQVVGELESSRQPTPEGYQASLPTIEEIEQALES